MGMCSYQTAYHMMTSATHRALASAYWSAVPVAEWAPRSSSYAVLLVPFLMRSVSHDKAAALQALGAEAVIDRGDLPTFVDRVLENHWRKPIDAVMDLVGGEMTNLFIDTMIVDMQRAPDAYPRLSIAGCQRR